MSRDAKPEGHGDGSSGDKLPLVSAPDALVGLPVPPMGDALASPTEAGDPAKWLLDHSARALLFYFVSSIALTVFNKWFFSNHNPLGFHFPVTVTAVHQFLVFIMVCALEPQLKRHGFGEIARAPQLRVPLGVLGAFCGIDWGLSNLSLRYIPLSLYEMTKSASPAMVLLVSTGMGLLAFTKRIGTIVVLICVGMFLAVSGGTLSVFTAESFPLFGFSCVAFATLISGGRIVYAQHALQRLHVPGHTTPGVNAVTMLYYAAPMSSLAILGPAMWLEGRDIGTFLVTAPSVKLGYVALAIFSSAVIAFALSLSEFFATRQTSALTLCVVGVTKQLLLIALAMGIFGEKLGMMNALGFVVALAGVALYNYAKKTGTIQAAGDPHTVRVGSDDDETERMMKQFPPGVSTIAIASGLDGTVLRPRAKSTPSDSLIGPFSTSTSTNSTSK
jgi:solute carrier family 35 protein C2